MKKWLNNFIAVLLYPGYCQCGACLKSYKQAIFHTTQYTEGSGCFPLCEKCWSELTPPERLSYYRQLWQKWVNDDGGDPQGRINGRAYEDVWLDIEAAVLAGK